MYYNIAVRMLGLESWMCVLKWRQGLSERRQCAARIASVTAGSVALARSAATKQFLDCWGREAVRAKANLGGPPLS